MESSEGGSVEMEDGWKRRSGHLVSRQSKA